MYACLSLFTIDICVFRYYSQHRNRAWAVNSYHFSQHDVCKRYQAAPKWSRSKPGLCWRSHWQECIGGHFLGLGGTLQGRKFPRRGWAKLPPSWSVDEGCSGSAQLRGKRWLPLHCQVQLKILACAGALWEAHWGSQPFGGNFDHHLFGKQGLHWKESMSHHRQPSPIRQSGFVTISFSSLSHDRGRTLELKLSMAVKPGFV